VKRIARRRIEKLLEMALQGGDRSRRYVELALKIARRNRVRIPRKYRIFCKRCFSVLIPGKTLTVRVRKGRIVKVCRVCGRVRRIPYGVERIYKRSRRA